jgi:integrase
LGSGDFQERVANPISDAVMTAAVRKFEAIAGELPLEHATAEVVKEFVDGLRREGLSEFTVLRCLRAMKAVTELLGSFEHPGAAGTNPFHEAEECIRRLAPPVGTVPPFPFESLQKLLSSPGYLATNDAAEPHSAARFWLPMLCVFACARPHDIIGLQVSDLEQHQDAWVLRVSSMMSADPRTGAPAVRWIPLHEELVRCGFVSYAAQRKLEGHVDFFGSGRETAKLSASAHRVSYWFSGLGRTMGIGQGCNLFELRRAFIAACISSGVTDEGIRLLAGRAVKVPSTLRPRPSYLPHDDALDQAIAWVRRLRFDGLELSHLYVDDPLSRSDEVFRAR